MRADAHGQKQGRDVLSFEELPNLGLKSKAMLVAADINSVPQFRALGAIAAYVQVKRSGAKVSLNLLWALEGALTGQRWQHVAQNQRTALLLALEDYEQQL